MTAAFENHDLNSMQEFMDKHLSVSQGNVNKTVERIKEWFLDVVKEAIKNSDLKNVKKEDVLKLVSDMYDKYIQPIDLPGPDVVVDPMLKQIILKQAGSLYYQFFIAQNDNSVPVFGTLENFESTDYHETCDQTEESMESADALCDSNDLEDTDAMIELEDDPDAYDTV